MIEFYGELSDECKIVRAKKISRNSGFMFLIVTVVIGIVSLTFGILNDAWYYALALIALFVVITVFAFITPKKRVLSFKIPTRLIIKDDTIAITALGGKESMKTKPITKIKKVIDMGDWYYFIFRFGDISNSWVCQKNLIVQGTIEEFEKIFTGKIVRKN